MYILPSKNRRVQKYVMNRMNVIVHIFKNFCWYGNDQLAISNGNSCFKIWGFEIMKNINHFLKFYRHYFQFKFYLKFPFIIELSSNSFHSFPKSSNMWDAFYSRQILSEKILDHNHWIKWRKNSRSLNYIFSL